MTSNIVSSLKLKEISYIHSKAYAAGELNHGPISLIEDGTIVLSVVTQTKLIENTISNMVEVKSRGAKVMASHKSGELLPRGHSRVRVLCSAD